MVENHLQIMVFYCYSRFILLNSDDENGENTVWALEPVVLTGVGLCSISNEMKTLLSLLVAVAITSNYILLQSSC